MADFENNALYKRIAEHLRQEIVNGKWCVREKMPSSRHLSAEYECAINTIERALQELANRGYIIRKPRSGTYVNSAFEKNGNEKKLYPNIIGAVIFDVKQGIWSSIVRGIDDEASKNGYHLLLINTDRDLQKAESSVQGLLEEGIDGLIYSPVFCPNYQENNLRILKRIEKSNTPYVLVDGYISCVESNYVVSDNFHAAYRLINKLIEFGHRRILAITDIEGYTARTRYNGYVKAMEDSEVGLDKSLVIKFPKLKDRSKLELISYFKDSFKHKDFSAVFTINDRYAASAYYALKAMGKDVPRDVSITTFDKTDESSDVPLNFTCAIQPTYEIGEKAALILCEELELRRKSISKIVMKSSFEEGNSVSKYCR